MMEPREPRFSGISLRNISKQLNTEISVLLHDLKQIKQKLNEDILAVIQQICKEPVDVDLSSHDDTKLNLCHLIGLMITYECCIVLRNILSADPTPSVDCDFDVIGFFQRQLKLNRTHSLSKHQDQTQMLDHTIDRCREQSPIILLCDHQMDALFDSNSNHSMPSNSSSNTTPTHCDCHCIESKTNRLNDSKTQSLTNSDQSAVNTIRFDLSMINSKIYTKCKMQRNRRCPLRDIPILNRSISSIPSIPSIPSLRVSTLSRSPSIGTMSRCASSSSNTPKSEPTLYSHTASIAAKRRTKVLNSKYRSAPNLSKLGEITTSSGDKLEVRSKSENDIKDKRRRVRIPKSSLSPFAERNYHQFGRRHNLPIYSMEEISKHRTIEDCWIIVDNLVLDVTAFLPHHPASYECILKKSGGGQVCDLDFKFHSKSAQNLFWKFVIGRVERETSCIVM